jgi:hypothetical protein
MMPTRSAIHHRSHERLAKLRTLQQRLTNGAFVTGVFAASLAYIGQPALALAPLSFLFGVLGGIVVLRMKISDVEKVG